MAKGISLIQGNKYPKIGEPTTYSVAAYYPGTIPPQDESSIKWKIYAEQSTGNWRELRGSERTGKQATFSFPQQWYGKKILVEAYLNNPEIKAPPGLIIMPVPGERKIDSIGFFDSNWNPLQQTPKYGQTLNVRINTVNMLGEDLKISLWERDTYSDTGHDPTENTNVWDSEKTYKVTDPNGRVEFSMPLDLMWRLKADKGIFDIEGSEHEYYLLVKGAGARTKYSRQQNVRNEVDASTTSAPRNAPTPAPVANRPASPSTPAPSTNNTPATNPPAITPAPVSQQQPVTVGGVGANPPATVGGVSPAVVNDVTVEGLVDAYFAKKEYTKKTTDSAGTFEYTVGSNGNKTGTDAEKTNIATAILGKQNVKDLVKEKRYTTLEAIKAGLTQAVYNRNEKVTFETFKLEAEFVKVNSAPLETKLYLVAKAYVLEDKQATIIIKEKDGLIKGTADAVLPILEITEAEMEQATPTTGEVPGTEKLEFTSTIKDGLVKIPVHLRPKSDEDLKTWKDKLAKGIEDGTYEYEFGNPNNISDEAKRKSVAAIILNNVKNGNRLNTKIEDGKTAYVADIEKALQLIEYAAGAKISFTLYKKQPELLYLNVKATGEKEHNKDFLKAEGAYFEIAKKCPRCEAEITLKDIENSFDVYANQKDFRQKIVDSLNKFIKQRKDEGKDLHLNTCLRKAHFFAQVGVETLGIHGNWIIEGNINHSVESAKSAFGDRARTLERNGLLSAYCSDRPQTRLYNYLYALGNGYDNGNGNEASGDGWKFRGRGLKQITGKGNYKIISEVIKEIFPAEYDALPQANAGEEKLVSHPEQVEEIDYAVITAIAYWEKHKIWELADTITSKTSSDDDFKKIRQKVVGASGFKWKDAKEYFQKTYDAFRVGECQKGESSEACTPDCSQCFNYEDVWENPEISSDNGGKNNNRYGSSTRGHKGIDILSGPTYKDVHSIMCGTVEKIVTSFVTNKYGSLKLGNVVNIKSKDKNGNTVYILYCHLDQVDVIEGQNVKHGEKIALSGSTGNASDGSLPNGVPGRGINKENWHVHIEASADGVGAVTFFGKDRLQPEDYMKTKFDTDGNAIK